MATTERTYSFRAPSDLGERLERARQTLAGLAESHGDEAVEWALDEFDLELRRRWDGVIGRAQSQSSLIRATIELLVAAAEKVARDLSLAGEYEAWAAKDDEGEAVRAGALRAASAAWRDE